MYGFALLIDEERRNTMIAESHAHYSYRKFKGSFSYLCYEKGGYSLKTGNFNELIEEMQSLGVSFCIEPAIDFESNYAILDLNKSYPDYFYPCIGIHPTRTFKVSFKKRFELSSLAEDNINKIVAIGETGLDYHYKRKEQHRLRQLYWFVYQLKLADKLKLPLVLHIRQSDSHALKVLNHYRSKLHGGVVHCFNGDYSVAKKYIDLGFHLGIGGSLLQKNERTAGLCEAVSRIPEDRILIETDSPYVLPYLKDTPPFDEMSDKKIGKLANTSLILPAVINKIAELRNTSPEAIEKATEKNTRQLFGL